MVPSAGLLQSSPSPQAQEWWLIKIIIGLIATRRRWHQSSIPGSTRQRDKSSTAFGNGARGLDRRGGLSPARPAVPLDPFRPGPAHVVQLRPIAMHEAADDSPDECQDIHPRTPQPQSPGALTGPDFGRLEGGCEAAIRNEAGWNWTQSPQLQELCRRGTCAAPATPPWVPARRPSRPPSSRFP
jgi:hypothetical protein